MEMDMDMEMEMDMEMDMEMVEFILLEFYPQLPNGQHQWLNQEWYQLNNYPIPNNCNLLAMSKFNHLWTRCSKL